MAVQYYKHYRLYLKIVGHYTLRRLKQLRRECSIIRAFKATKDVLQSLEMRCKVSVCDQLETGKNLEVKP